MLLLKASVLSLKEESTQDWFLSFKLPASTKNLIYIITMSIYSTRA